MSPLPGTCFVSADAYRRTATDCLALARAAGEAVEREKWQELADGWLMLADWLEAVRGYRPGSRH